MGKTGRENSTEKPAAKFLSNPETDNRCWKIKMQASLFSHPVLAFLDRTESLVVLYTEKSLR